MTIDETMFPPLPEEVVRAWVAAGATYGTMQDDPMGDSIRCRREPLAGMQNGLPGFTFTKWKLRKAISKEFFESLPIPPTPFGLSLSAHHGFGVARGKLQGLVRFRETLVELELWGDSRVHNEFDDFQALHKLRSLGVSSTDAMGSLLAPHLQSLQELESLRVGELDFNVDAARALSELSHLKQLSLKVIQSVTPDALDVLASMKSLTDLSLSLPALTPEVSDSLSRWQCLRHFELLNRPLPDGAFPALGGLPYLEELKLVNANVTDQSLAELCRSRSLTRLDLYGAPVTDSGLTALRTVKSLKSLKIANTPAGTEAIDAIAQLTELQDLELSETQVKSEHLQSITGLGQLRSLGLSMTVVRNEGLAHVAQLSHLSSLNLYGTKVDDDGLLQLLALKNLKSLDLRATRVTDAGLSRLKGMTSLESMELDVKIITDTGLQNYLSVIRNPRLLRLQNTRITDAGLSYLVECRNLEYLSLESTKVSSLPGFRQLTNLKMLNLCHTPLSEEGFDELSRMQNLITLDLSNLQTPHTVDSLLKLKSLATLVALAVYSWPLTPAEIDQLSAAMPHCKVRN